MKGEKITTATMMVMMMAGLTMRIMRKQGSNVGNDKKKVRK